MIKILLLKTATLPNGDEFLKNDLKWPAVGSGGVTVASNTRGWRFKASRWQFYLLLTLLKMQK